MLRRACHVSLTALVMALAVLAGGHALPAQAAATRIMPLGDPPGRRRRLGHAASVGTGAAELWR